MKNIGVILAGGFGARFGSSTPKQYLSINNKEIISYSIDAFYNSKYVDKLIVVVDEDEKYKSRIKEGLRLVSSSGTGSYYIDKKYNASSKTGTSESILDSDGDGVSETFATNNFDLLFGAGWYSMMGECYKTFKKHNRKIWSRAFVETIQQISQSKKRRFIKSNFQH